MKESTGTWDLETLKSVESNTFDRVWKLFLFISEEERHFNDLQSKYRMMASGWLLASFGAIGFVISEVADIGVPPLILIAGIAAAGAVGILLLWVVDLLVYHRLLDACFIEGLKLEESCQWMPPFRHNMMRMMRGQGVLFRVVGFYLGPVLLLILTSGGALIIWVVTEEHRYEAFFVGATSIVLISILSAGWKTYKKTENTDRLVELLKEGCQESEPTPQERTEARR